MNTQAREAFEDGLRRFRDEAEQLRTFRNEPYIVSCLNYFEQNGTAYLVMDKREGVAFWRFTAGMSVIFRALPRCETMLLCRSYHFKRRVNVRKIC